MVTRREQSSIFPEVDLFGGAVGTHENLFNVQSGRSGVVGTGTSGVRTPTAAQQKAAEEAARQQQIEFYRGRLNELRTSPDWVNASLARRETMLADWRKNQYDPVVNAVQDQDLKRALARLPDETFGADIRTLRGAINEGSQIKDVGIGAVTNLGRTMQAVGDYFPASRQASAIDSIDRALAENRDLTFWEKSNLPVPYWYALSVQGASLPEVRERAYQELNNQLQEANVTQQAIDRLNAGRSVGAGDRAIERQEDQQRLGSFGGTLYNLAANPLDTLGETIEQAPNLAAAITAATVGGLPGAAAAGGILSGQDALASAYEQVSAMPLEQLQQLPAFQELIAQGVSETDARNRLALRAANDAAIIGGAVGVATGPIGVEAGAGQLINRTLLNPATQATAGAARSAVTRIAANPVARGAARTLVEGAEEGGTQLGANIGQQRATGADIDLLEGVGEAAALGIGLAAPVSGVTVGAEFATQPPAAQGQAPAQPTITSPDNIIPGIPDPQQAAQQVAQSVAVDQGESLERQTSLQAVYDTIGAIRQRTGEALTEDEVVGLFSALFNAETAGNQITNLSNQLDVLRNIRAVPPGLASTSLTQAYQEYAAMRVANEAATTAQEIVTGVQNESGTVSPTVVAGSVSDSTTATTATTDTTATTTSPATATTVTGNVADTGAGRTGSNNTTAVVSDAASVAPVGGDTAANASVSGPNNQPVSTTGETVSASQRDVASAAGPGPATVGGPAVPGTSQAGVNLGGVEVGQNIVYTPTTKGARPIQGSVTRVNPNGTFSMRSVSGRNYSRLNPNNARSVTDAIQEPSPAQSLLRSQEPEVGLQEVGAGNTQGETAAASTQQVNTEQQPQEIAIPVQSGYDLPGYTPEGREVSLLQEMIESMMDSPYAHDMERLTAVLIAGDLAQADAISQSLYVSGLRGFAPASDTGGMAGAQIDNVFVTKLTSEERVLLQDEYARIKEDLPIELQGFKAMRDAAVQDVILSNSGQQPNTSVLSKISTVARKIIDKIAKAIVAVLAAITINTALPINDAVAQQGMGTVTTSYVVPNASQTTSVVNSWVQESRDNNGQSYIIADKEAGAIHIMAADGTVLATAPALYGYKTGDGMSVGETPAGIFSIRNQSAPASYGGDLQQFATAPNGDVYAIHRVLTTNPSQNRVGRLASETATDNRISLGCINIPVETYNQYLGRNFQGKLYIIPEQNELGSVFRGIENQSATQDLQNGQTLSEDMSDITSGQYRSSTSNEGALDMASTSPITGAEMTMAAAQMDTATATSVFAAPSNMPADMSMGLLAGLSISGAAGSFLSRLRGGSRTPVNNSSQGGTGAGTTNPQNGRELGRRVPPNITPTELLDRDHTSKDAHRVTAILPDNQVQQQEYVRDGLTKQLMDRLIDTQSAFLDWTDRAGLVAADTEFDSAPVWQQLKLAPGLRQNIENRIAESIYKPISDVFLRVSDETGIAPDQVAIHMGIWSTMQHIPEANAALRARMQRSLDEAVLTGTPDDIARIQQELTAFDDYQRTGQNPVRMAGGLTNAQAQVLRQGVEGYGYRMEDLQQVNTSIVNAFKAITQMAVNGGVLLQEEVDSWGVNNFSNYVALYVDQNPDRSDGYLGDNLINPTDQRKRNGALDPANHAVVTLRQAIYRVSAQLASKGFKDQLHADFEARAVRGDLAGLHRINTASPMYQGEAAQARGIIYTTREVDNEGNPVIRRYKYYFDDPDIMKGLSFYSTEPKWAIQKGLTTLTNLQARLNTKWRPIFPVINWVRDAWERSTSLSSRAIYDSDGNMIPLRTIAPRMYLATLNPANIMRMAGYLVAGKGANTPLVQAFEALRQQGGYSAYVHALDSGKQGFRTELQKLRGPRSVLSTLDRFFTTWNDVFSAASAAAGYKVLTDLNVPARDAAFRSLDVMNIHNRGFQTNLLRTVYPFVTPTFEGGRNLIRNLATTRGRLLFTTQVLMGAALYSLMQAFAPDDDDYGDALNAMPLHNMSRFIPFYMKDGSYLRVPVSFGSSRVAWVLGAGLNRLTQGATNPGDLTAAVVSALAQEIQPVDLSEELMADNVVVGLILAATPQVLTPGVEVALNRNAFGSPLHGTANREAYASDNPRARTPTVWVNLAQDISKVTGGAIDLYPESVKHLVQSYLTGPLSGITTAIEANSLYTTGGVLTTRQEVGWLADSAGVASVWNNGEGAHKRVYFNYQDKAIDIMRRYHVLSTDPDNKPGEKAQSAADRILQAGGSYDEAQLVYLAIQYDSMYDKQNRDLNELVRSYRRAGDNMELLTTDYQIHAQNQEAMMREFISQARRLNIR